MSDSIKKFGFILYTLFLFGCNSSGIQGGEIPQIFKGIQSIEVLSPTAVKLSWSLDKKFTKYRIYRDNSNIPIKEETFQSTMISSLNALTTYNLSVTGVFIDEKEEGVGNFQTFTTYPSFTGIAASEIKLTGPTSVLVNWKKESDNITYNIYYKKQTESWNFNVVNKSVLGANDFLITNLDEGTYYCFYVTAEYKDGTFEPAKSAETATATAPCLTTSSDLQGLPTILANQAIPGYLPWFQAIGGQETMLTHIYEKTTNTRIATRTGNGLFRSFSKLNNGYKELYALVSQNVNGVVKTAKANITIKNIQGEDVNGIYSRYVSAQSALFPRLISGGRGIQQLGAQTVKGDFNCDGIPDLAVSAPISNPYVNSDHITGGGSVLVYYGERYMPPGSTSQVVRLKTDVNPSIEARAPYPQLIYYPVTYSNYNFGTKLAVGNFNGDCKRYYPSSPSYSYLDSCENMFAKYGDPNNSEAWDPDTVRLDKLKLIYRCDDLAIASNPLMAVDGSSQNNKGGLYLIYGDANQGLISGSGSNNFGINEATCDPSTGTCRAARMAHHDVDTYHFGKSLAVGDFNNDGYDDLAVGGTKNNGGNYYGKVTVLRGSNRGVLPSNSSYANAEIIANGSGAESAFYSAPVASPTTLANSFNSSAPNFAWSVGSAPNSRSCQYIRSDSTIPYRQVSIPKGKGYDFTKCDDLIIGDPSRGSNRGSIVSCKANFSATSLQDSLTQRKITSWKCAEHFPEGLEAGASYGFSLLGVKNQNGYPLTLIPELDFPDVTGALFVGAPYADTPNSQTATSNSLRAGKVFGYYMTPHMKGTGSGTVYGGIQDILLDTSLNPGPGHTVQTSMEVPCNRKSDNVNSSKQCSNQVIFDSSPQANEAFGYSLGQASEFVIDAPELPKLIIGVPYRDVSSVEGTKSNGGAVLVYKGDLSTLENGAPNTIGKSGCFGRDCYYFSGGINPFGPSLLYNSNVSTNSMMGLSGGVGDNFMGDASSGEVDIISSAKNDNHPVESNGGVFLYKANSGFPPSQQSPDEIINVNISKEVNYKFEQAKVVGDLNGDGYEDVITRIKIGSTKIELIIFYGSFNGLITSPEPTLAPVGLGPKIISSANDDLLGIKFFSIGDVNGDGFDDILLIGETASYVYYGSSIGVVSNSEPSVSPVGKNPIKFGLSNPTTAVVTFHQGIIQGDSTQVSPNYDVSMQSVAHGDYNGDSYEDFAIGVNSTDILPSGIDVSDLGGSIDSSRMGRVYVVYGSPKGPQVGSTGFIKLKENSSSTVAANVVAKNPCSPDPTNPVLRACYVQMIGSIKTNSVQFGWAMASVKSMEGVTNSYGLVISDPSFNSNDGEVYYLRGSIVGINAISDDIQVLKSHNVNGGNKFGYQIINAGDINKDGKDDIVITAPVVTTNPTTSSGFFVFYGFNTSGTGQFFGAATISTPAPVLNARHVSTVNPKPQYIIPESLIGNSAVGFAYGVSSIGDFNKDGYSDIIVNVNKGDYELDTLKRETGYYIIYFGSAKGLMSDFLFSPNPKCYGGNNLDAICEPFQFFLPDSIESENTFLTTSAFGDINGDGYPDILLGALGRNHPSGFAFSVGVIYVLY